MLDIDTGRLELPEDLPVLPERAELVAELELAMQKWVLSFLLNSIVDHRQLNTVEPAELHPK